MKYILLLITLITLSLNAQVYEVDTIQGVVKIENNLNGVINYYTMSNQLNAFISSGTSSRNTINIANSNGVIVMQYQGLCDSINVLNSSYTRNVDLITSLNNIFIK